MPFVRIGEMNTHQLVRHLLETVSTRFDSLEVQMSEITGAVGRLQSSVNRAVALIREGSSDQSDRVAELQAALAAEREAATALAASEDAEDAEQNAALADAKAEVDRLLGEVSSAAGDINAQADALDAAVASRDSGVDEPATDGSAGVGDTPATDEPGDATSGGDAGAEVAPPVAEPEPTPANDGDGSLPATQDPTTGTDGTDGETATGEVPAETPTTGVDEPATTPEAPTSADESGNTTNA